MLDQLRAIDCRYIPVVVCFSSMTVNRACERLEDSFIRVVAVVRHRLPVLGVRVFEYAVCTCIYACRNVRFKSNACVRVCVCAYLHVSEVTRSPYSIHVVHETSTCPPLQLYTPFSKSSSMSSVDSTISSLAPDTYTLPCWFSRIVSSLPSVGLIRSLMSSP